MALVRSYLSKIALNVQRLNSTIKIYTVIKCIKKKKLISLEKKDDVQFFFLCVSFIFIYEGRKDE